MSYKASQYKNKFLRCDLALKHLLFGSGHWTGGSVHTVLSECWDSVRYYSGSFDNGHSAGWIHVMKPQTQTHWLTQFSLEFMQLCDGGIYSTEWDAALLEINHHCYSAALQGTRYRSFGFVMAGKQVPFAFVHKTPGLCVVSEGAGFLALSLDALVGYSNVPVPLSLHLPDMDTRGEALEGEDLRGFIETAVTVGIIQLCVHSLSCFEISRHSKNVIDSVEVQHESSWQTDTRL